MNPVMKQDCFLQGRLWKVKDRLHPDGIVFVQHMAPWVEWSPDAVLHLCKVSVVMNIHEVWSMCPTISWLSFNTGKT